MLKSLLLATAVVVLQPAPTRVLFVGNSLTYANDLPAVVCALARAAGRQAVCEMIAKPDFSLEDHWNDSATRQAINRGWDVVVLQQGPSALPASRVLLVDYAKRLDGEIRRNGGRTAVYMVWPAETRRGDFSAVSQSYAAAAKAVHGLLLPVGDAWRAAWAIDAQLPLYGPDRFHPSPTGTYLAALVIYEGIFGAPAPLAPVMGGTIANVETLQRAARETNARMAR